MVLLLIELYREKEDEFSNALKRSNKIWAEIAAEMNEANPSYKLIAQQCSSKMSGLKRTYKNIVDLNKKSGSNRNSWAFFSVCFITHTYTSIYFIYCMRYSQICDKIYLYIILYIISMY